MKPKIHCCNHACMAQYGPTIRGCCLLQKTCALWPRKGRLLRSRTLGQLVVNVLFLRRTLGSTGWQGPRFKHILFGVMNCAIKLWSHFLSSRLRSRLLFIPTILDMDLINTDPAELNHKNKACDTSQRWGSNLYHDLWVKEGIHVDQGSCNPASMPGLHGIRVASCSDPQKMFETGFCPTPLNGHGVVWQWCWNYVLKTQCANLVYSWIYVFNTWLQIWDATMPDTASWCRFTQ